MAIQTHKNQSRFGTRQWAILIIVAAVIAINLRLWFMFLGGNADTNDQSYFYDLETGQLFAASSRNLPPTVAPSDTGGSLQGVRAFVYACGDCSEGNPREIGYLLMYTSEYVLAMAKLGRGELPSTEELQYTMDTPAHTLVRRVDESEWYTILSREGQQITQFPATMRCPGGTQPVLCTP